MRLSALLLAAGLAAPVTVAAGPSNDPWSTPPQVVEKFEWSTSRGRLGVTVMGLPPELRKHFGAPADQGVLVAHVEPGTPASTAGIEVGDVIVAVHGRKIGSAADVISALAGAAKGERARIELVRDRKSRALDATLVDAPHSDAFSWMRGWMKQFDHDHAHRAPLDESWFREWMKPFEWMKPTEQKSGSRFLEETSWLSKLRDLFQPRAADRNNQS